MSTKNPKYSLSAYGYFEYLRDYGAVFDLNRVNKRIIQCRASSSGHDFYVDFILEKEYNDSIEDIIKHLEKKDYEIVNVRLY